MPFLESSSSKSIPQPLPSLPPSPTEQDLGGASLWRDADEEHDIRNNQRMSNGSVKGKERAREISLDEDENEVDEGGELTPTVDSAYPPSKDEEEESRRVEQNLKRLEEEERQRRKAARESAAATTPSSVISDVSRRASLLFSSSRRSGSVGSRPPLHHVHSQIGQSSEDALPLGDLHTNSNLLVSPAPSQPSSPAPHNTRKLPIPTIVENPFEPPDSATPLRSFQQQHEDSQYDAGEPTSGAVMRPSSPPPPETVSSDDNSRQAPAEDRPPLLQATSSFSRPHPAPPPLPLDLPPPKTPPPRTHTPSGTRVVASPPTRVSPPSTRGRANGELADQNRSEEEEHRWWTDWLCGCREDKDRDNAGRTNPFE